ncbi:MAG: hypothetical protein IJH64_09495 [Oscillospiraceae bacterium]|nr:hypothetical protein [Oscillospiraceae bacterium]
MTAQIPDTYRYKSKVYEIVAMTNPMGFDPRDYGLEPHSSCTACWRGYWCEYVIKYGKLIMERLLLYNQDGNYPDFNGVHVSPQEYKEIEYRESFDEGEKLKKKTIPDNWGHRTYNANMKMDYTGKIVLGKGFLDEFYIHMGFQRPWAYKDLKEFDFKDGKLISVTDHSAFAEKLREKIREDPEGFDHTLRRTIPTFIDESFSLDAAIKAWWI